MSRPRILFEELAQRRFEPPALGSEEAHVWGIDLRAEPDHIAYFGGLLNEDERQRAARYKFDRHRRRFIVGQGALRHLLGCYSALQPAALRFELGPKGKPALIEDPSLHFNLSHSSERAVVALARKGALGVDIERRREMKDADNIAKRFFSRPEIDSYLSVSEELRQRAFFNCWTRKEAFVKALGEGLFVSLDRFDVSLIPGEPAELLAIEGDPEAARAWCLTELEPADDFAGALATEWLPSRVRAWHLDAALVASL